MGTYRLAVCEDDRAAQEEICRLCDDILTQDGIGHRIVPFSSATELGRSLEAGAAPFDLLVLDIEMRDRGKTGMELARELRRRRDRTSILFVTGHEEYLAEGYDVQPVHFLLKPPDRGKLAEALHIDWEFNHSPRTVLLQRGGRALRLVLSEVRYIETGPNHSVKISTTGRGYLFQASLAYMETMLPARSFARCHKSYLVNLAHVAEMDREGIVLDNGEQLPVGRKYAKSCQTAFIEYLNR